jgi:hypothetical protein
MSHFRQRATRQATKASEAHAPCSARACHGLTLALTGPGVPFFGSLSRIAGRVDELTD